MLYGLCVHYMRVQVRNRHMSKRETEKLIKEVWKERMADNLANKGAVQPELGDFLFQFLQKKVGIQSAVIEVPPPRSHTEPRVPGLPAPIM